MTVINTSTQSAQLSLNPAIHIFMNVAVSILTLFLKQPLPSPAPSFTPNVTTVTHFTIVYLTGKYTDFIIYETLLLVLLSKPPNPLKSPVISDLYSGTELINAHKVLTILNAYNLITVQPPHNICSSTGATFNFVIHFHSLALITSSHPSHFTYASLYYHHFYHLCLPLQPLLSKTIPLLSQDCFSWSLGLFFTFLTLTGFVH